MNVKEHAVPMSHALGSRSRVLQPSSCLCADVSRSCLLLQVVVWVSDDGGETYHRPSPAGLIHGTCETSLTQLADGRIVLLGNDGGAQDKGPCSGNNLQHYFSTDGGDSFGEAQCDAALVNADCQAPVLAVGSSVVVANPEGPRDEKGNYDRTALVVHVSDDSGDTFHTLPITFDTGGGPNATIVAYSSLTFVDASKPRTVGLAWETDGFGADDCHGAYGGRCRILFSVFDVPGN